MPDGAINVIVTYGLVTAVLGIWFWMMLSKLRRLQREQDRSDG